jgi:Curli production assembly/transport component CsgG/Tetratricopeptide repeat
MFGRPQSSLNAILALSLVCLFLFGCSTVGVKVPVMRPAEINLKGKKELVVGQISGREAKKMSAYVKQKAVDSGYFKVIDRKHLDKVMAELKLSTSDLADTSNRKELGKLMTGSVLIMGNMLDYKYTEDMTRETNECTKTVKKKVYKYKCTSYYRKGNAVVRASFDVVDIETGETLRSKALESKRTDSTSATNETPAKIDRNLLLDTCMQEVATKLMRAIAPWKEMVTANFKKDGDLPMMETGISYAQAGLWDDALVQFESATEMADTNPDISPNVAAVAYWNLGLACEYTGQFDEAESCIKKAFALSSDDDYLKELKNIETLKSDKKKLREQL